MKTIVMKTTMAGPQGVTLAGQVIEVDDQQAEALVAGGYAQYTSEKPAQAKAAASKRTAGRKGPAHEEVSNG